MADGVMAQSVGWSDVGKCPPPKAPTVKAYHPAITHLRPHPARAVSHVILEPETAVVVVVVV